MTYAQSMSVAAQVATLEVNPPASATSVDGTSNPTTFEISGVVKCDKVSLTASNTKVTLQQGASYLLTAHVRPNGEPTPASGTTELLEVFFYDATNNSELTNTSPQSNKPGGTQIYYPTRLLIPFQQQEFGPFIIACLILASDIPSGGLDIELRARVTSPSSGSYTYSANTANSTSRVNRNYMIITQV